MILLASMCGLRVVPRDTPYTVPEFSLAAADDPFHIVVPCSFRKCDLLSQWPNPSSFRETQTTRIIIFLLKKMGIRALFSLVFFSLHIYFFFSYRTCILKKILFHFSFILSQNKLTEKIIFSKDGPGIGSRFPLCARDSCTACKEPRACHCKKPCRRVVD